MRDKSVQHLKTPAQAYTFKVALRALHDYIRLSPCFYQDIVTRHLAEKSAAEDQLPRLGPVAWAAGSQSELTPSESLATSDAVRNTLLLPSMAFSHISNLSSSPEVFLSILFSSHHPAPTFWFFFITFTCFLSYISLVSQPCHLSSSSALSLLICPCLSLFSDFNFPPSHLHCL